MENKEPQNNNFKDRVLASIESEHVKTYSKAHFAVRIALLVALAGLILIVSIFLLNFAFFILRISGRGSLLGFGPRGLWFFIRAFPWTLLLVDIGLILVLEGLLRRFKFGYRNPILYTLVALFAIVISVGFVIDRGTALNDILLKEADEHHLPIMIGEFYRGARRPPMAEGICECRVVSVATSGIITARDVIVIVTSSLQIIPPEGFPSDSLAPGQIIFVAGERIGSGTLQAFGIGTLPPNSIEPGEADQL